MSSHRKPRLLGARKRARAVTLCAATFGAAAMPALAQAATSTSGSATAVSITPQTAVHLASAALQSAALQEAKATGTATAIRSTAKVESVSTTTKKASSSSGEKTYKVVSGDTLSGIAERALGDGDKYTELFKLNKNRSEPGGRTLTDANLIVTGWTIELPAGSKSAKHASSASSSSSSSSSSSGTESSESSSSSSRSSASTASTTSSSSSSSSSSYANNLNGWINEAISILSQHGYSVTYNAIYETAMNESSGNPSAENNSDSNAAAGNPSKGLLQTTQTTFDAYALSGYNDIWNPVDNIIAAVIYAQNTYGGLDTVVANRCGGSCWYGY